MQFTSVTVTRSYEQVVRQIQEQILRGAFTHGQKLPSERDLSEQFGVSRGIVREAVKVLSTMGLVESRQGSGLYVRRDPIPSISRALTISVSSEEESVLSLFAFREELEVIAVRFAAAHHTGAQGERIAAAFAANRQAIAAGDWEAFGDTDQAFHLAIADAAGNPYLLAVLSAVRQMQRDIIGLMTTYVGTLATADAQHAAIFAALMAGDADTAAAAMRAHVRYSASSSQCVLDNNSNSNSARPHDRHGGQPAQGGSL